MLKSISQSFFGFNRQQRNGLVVLVSISFALLIVRLSYPRFIEPRNMVVKNLELFEQRADSATQQAQVNYSAHTKTDVPRNKLFVFDPNTVTLEQLLKMGMREKTAQRLIKFRSKGFKFKTKDDLKKVYGISEKYYSVLAPYVLIAAPAGQNETVVQPLVSDKEEKREKTTESDRPRVATKLELNTADSLALLDLKGIGPSYAKRILKYRTLLGGFVSVEQLKEVYGFTEELYATVAPQVTVNDKLIQKINLSRDDFKTLNRHPYLSYELTKSLCNWRRKTDLNTTTLKSILNDDALYQKLVPYISFEP